jgi:microcystin-dependent protein
MIAVSQPYIGEIRIVGFNFAPTGWALASGQAILISQNDTLFNLIGTIYGGDGQTYFNLPNVQSRMPMHMGTATGLSPRTLGQMAGTESVTFASASVPSAPQAPIQALAPAPTNPVVSTMSPFLAVNFIIAMFGIFPSQT